MNLLRFTRNGSRWMSNDIVRYLLRIVISIILGLVAGLGSLLFHYMLKIMRRMGEPSFLNYLFEGNRYEIVLIPLIGALVIATMTRLFKSIAREKGVLSVIKSVILNNGFIPIRVTVFHVIASIACIGTGAPLGPEGPVAKLGSGIGSILSRIIRLDQKDMTIYAAAGAGAAISAVFNAPIAGVFFGVEVILMNDLNSKALSVFIVASVVADILSRAVMGNDQLIQIPHYTVGPIFNYPLYFILAIVCGIVSILYFLLKKSIRLLIESKLKIKNEYLRILPVAVLWGAILIYHPLLYETGYGPINSLLRGGIPLYLIALLVMVQVLFLALYVEAGGYGGTYAPAICIGAFLGFSFALAMNSFFHFSLDPTVCALVGMGGIMAGINSVPLTAIMLVFEITQDYTFILPLMLVSILAYLSTVFYNGGTVYVKELLDLGIDVRKRGEKDILGKIRVKELMRGDFDMVDHKMPFRMVMNIIMNSTYGDLFVIDDSNRLVGVITLKNVRQVIVDSSIVDLLIAKDLSIPVPVASAGERVSSAIQKIEEHDSDCIPVVESEGSKKIIGILTMNDIIAAYSTQLEELETSQLLQDQIK